MKKLLTLVVLVNLVYGGIPLPFNFNFNKPQTAHALAGDFSVFRKNSGNIAIPTSGAEIEMTWDTTVSESSNIQLQGDTKSIDLSEGGKYLVLYNAWAEETGAGTQNRRAFESYLTLDESEIVYGRGAGYIRDSNQDDQYAYTNGAAIIDAGAGEDLKINVRRDDTNPDDLTQTRAGTNGVSVLKMKDNLDYAIIPKTSNSTDISGNTSFIDVSFNNADELDTGSFGYTSGSSDITLKGSAGDYFLVTYNIRLNQTEGSGERQNYQSRLALDGVEIDGTKVTTYIRGDANSNGIYYGTLAYSGIIQKTSSSDEILNIQVRQENTDDGSPPATVIVGNETGVSIAALPDTAHYIMLTSTTTQAVPNTQSPIDFDEQIVVDSTAFSHSTTINPSRINIDLAGDYLFFSNIHALRTSGGGDRDPYRVEWRLDGTNTLGYGGHGSFLRGNQGSQNSYEAGSAGGLIIPGLSDTQYVEVTMFDEEDNADADLIPGDIAVQGVEMSLLFQTNVDVSATSSHNTNSQIPANNVYQGGGFVIEENTSSRNVTNITISESGTVDGSTGLDNIKLFYDQDTTAPYDCTGESYSGSESQFGSTDTTGFSGANGISSFTDSVGISTTSSLCVYVVYDVTESANDGETVIISINDPTIDVGVTSGGSISPDSAVAPTGQMTLAKADLTQIHYHWRNDDGSESAATSVDGAEDTAAGGFTAGTQRRLRIEVSAEGSANADPAQFRLQYAEKSGTCSASSGWEDVADVGGAWDIGDSTNLTFAANATNIGSQALGEVTDEELNFNGTQTIVDGGDKSVDVSIDGDEFAELEYTVISTAAATEGNTYCFRLVDESPDVTHSYRIPLTIDSAEVNSNLTDFPVYVDLSNLGSHFFSNVSSNGGDIRITESDGATEVAREVVSINTGAETGELHFKAPSISSSADTTFYIYYGAAGENEYQASSTYGSHNVWSNNFEAVYHFPTTEDSTGNGYTLTASNITNSGTTKVGTQAADFNGSNSLYSHPDPNLILSGRSAITFTGWIDSDVTNTDKGFLIADTVNGSDAGHCMRYDQSGASGGGSQVIKGCIDTSSGVSQYESASSVQTTDWQYVSQTWQPSQAIEMYINAVATTYTFSPTSRTGTTLVGAGTLYIGAGGKDTTSGGWDGRLDEFRFASAYRNSAWIAAEYSNQNTPLTFYSTSTEESLNNSPVAITYDVYPEANITADITVLSSGSQVSTLDAGSTAGYVGGTFIIERDGGDRILTDITIHETGTIDAQNDLDNINIYYDLDTSFPYDCTGETYNAGSDAQFGSTDTDGFSTANGSSTFTHGIGVTINTTQTFCGYVVLDVSSQAVNGETIGIQITNPSTDVVVTSSSVGPSTVVSPTGDTTVAASILTQTGYHWRNDDDNEVDATSATGDIENSPLLDLPRNTTYRLRYQVSNEGTVTSNATQFQLEYRTKVSACDATGSWQAVDVSTAFTMGSTSQLIDGNNTTDVTSGGISNPGGKTFQGTNGGQKEDDDTTGNITLSSSQFVEVEYAIEATNLSGYNTDYCFRLTDAGTPLPAYTEYAELTTREKQDFFIQRGTLFVSGTGVTLTAGVDYVAPASTSTAFVRITNTNYTGAGHSVQGTQSAINVTAYIQDQSDITSSFRIGRPTGAANSTRVSWEIIEYTGLAGADNEIIVRDVDAVTYGTTGLTATGTALSNVADENDLVVFITGQLNPNTGSGAFLQMQSTAEWYSTTSEPVFRRGRSGDAIGVSYAVVEFTGLNWKIQRVEHPYTAAGSTETEAINPVNSLSRSFIHSQKRISGTVTGLDDFGHIISQVTSGLVNFQLNSGSTPANVHTSVAWVIENTQTGDGSMQVFRSDSSVDGNEAVEPRVTVRSFGGPANRLSNISVFGSNDSTGSGTAFPRAILGLTATSTSQYELFESDAGQTQTYSIMTVQWPVAELAFQQNYYRFYVDNASTTPNDPWPVGGVNLGENTAITSTDDPLGEGERVRIRMSIKANNATFPESTVSFKLQYGRRDGISCSAISSWFDVGVAGSGEVWRGYDNTPIDGDTLTQSLLSADVLATYEEENNSAVNPNVAQVGDNIEYDWLIEHNGATQRSDYCFRMVESDGTEFSSYNYYPTLRTTGYTPVINNWRWYTDEASVTPTSHLANENVAPIDTANQEVLKLRLSLKELEGAPGSNLKFSLQYSQYSDFSDGGVTLVSSASCTENSIWCYADGGGNDNALIDEAVISDSDACSGGSGVGCGTHNESIDGPSTLAHPSLGTIEMEFTLKQAGARVGGVYYFRLYDTASEDVVYASTTYPSIQVESANLTFTIGGLPSGTVTEGITTDVGTTPAGVNFGTLPLDTEIEAAHRLSVNTNATEGYQILTYARQNLLNTYGTAIDPITSTNLAPAAWATGCLISADGCFGYHVGDDILFGGSTRFSPIDSYAAFDTTPREVMYSSIPINESQDIVYKIQVGELQTAGDYETEIVYIAIPTF
ncbi:hypothetical protein KC723_02445 [Candidatus Kaiserbacteria bacterium]|nr:hypothetical protein [Candidatus Kaiserbacteria bacterium]